MTGSREAVEALLAHADSRDKNVRNRVALELSKLKEPGAREAIADATRSPVWRQRFAAARGMRLWPDDQRLRASELQALLVDPRDSIRWAVVRVIAEQDRLEAVGPLAATDPSPTVRQVALLSLAHVPEAMSIALEALRDDDHRVRNAAAAFFRQNANVEALEALTRTLADRFMRTRVLATWAVAEIGGPKAAPAIIPLLRDRKRFVRRVAARALGKLGDASAFEPLLAMLERSTTAESKSAAIAGLGLLNDRRAVTAVIDALRSAWEDDPSHPHGREGVDRWNIRRAATIALLQLGGDDAERELQRLPESWLEPLRRQLERSQGTWHRYGVKPTEPGEE